MRTAPTPPRAAIEPQPERARYGTAAFPVAARFPRLILAVALFAGACMPAVRSAPPAAAEIPSLEAHLARNPSDADGMVRLAAAYRDAEQMDNARAMWRNRCPH